MQNRIIFQYQLKSQISISSRFLDRFDFCEFSSSFLIKIPVNGIFFHGLGVELFVKWLTWPPTAWIQYLDQVRAKIHIFTSTYPWTARLYFHFNSLSFYFDKPFRQWQLHLPIPRIFWLKNPRFPSNFPCLVDHWHKSCKLSLLYSLGTCFVYLKIDYEVTWSLDYLGNSWFRSQPQLCPSESSLLVS